LIQINKLLFVITKSNLQSGQTLIETLVAALVLVMGITAAVTLAIYGFTATEGINKQLIAVGLAREAMEAVAV
jgi:Tfp pilus assembly protein PilV